MAQWITVSRKVKDVKTRSLYSVMFAVAVCFSACAQDTKLPKIPALTRVDVVNDHGGLTVKSIEDPAQLNSITDFFNQNRKGWQEAWFGSSPGGPFTVALYAGTNCCAEYGIAEDCLVCGSLLNRSKQQRAELLRLIGDLPKTLSEVVLPGISNITEIVVMANLTNGIVGHITNAQTINQIVEVVNRHQTGWETNWFGQPMPDVVLKLRNKDGFVVEFCAGAGFLVRCEDEEFMNTMLKHVKKQETDEILKLFSRP